jgi:AmiR/NasT family two-component response regulator
VSKPDKPQTEVEQLRQALERRPVIDQARGVLMAAYGCSPQQAWEILLSASQNTNIKLHTVAEQINAVAQDQPLSTSLQKAVDSALKALEP